MRHEIHTTGQCTNNCSQCIPTVNLAGMGTDPCFPLSEQPYQQGELEAGNQRSREDHYHGDDEPHYHLSSHSKNIKDC